MPTDKRTCGENNSNGERCNEPAEFVYKMPAGGGYSQIVRFCWKHRNCKCAQYAMKHGTMIFGEIKNECKSTALTGY
jgi:hypothetical protein